MKIGRLTFRKNDVIWNWIPVCHKHLWPNIWFWGYYIFIWDKKEAQQVIQPDNAQ